jgi:hypothetical protein
VVLAICKLPPEGLAEDTHVTFQPKGVREASSFEQPLLINSIDTNEKIKVSIFFMIIFLILVYNPISLFDEIAYN